MDKKTFELELVQLEDLFSKSRSNKYSDSRKTNYFNSLHKVFQHISQTNYSSFDQKELEDHRLIFQYLYNGLEFLDNSTLNFIPFELVYCLTDALSDWVDSSQLIIVTSLSNRMGEFYFEGWPKELERNIKQLINSKYSVNIEHRLIRISLPKALSRDYFSGVVLYHELGHFIDLELNISERIFFKKYRKRTEDKNSDEEAKFHSHLMEFFADLFAAQYVNDCSSLYLNHIAGDDPEYITHPATKKRIEVVTNFLQNKCCDEIDLIQNALKDSGIPQLSHKHKILDPNKSDFGSLVPQELNDKKELHSIFKLGWELWLESETNFLKDFNRRQKYYIINNLIEKSISNYNVSENWKMAKTL